MESPGARTRPLTPIVLEKLSGTGPAQVRCPAPGDLKDFSSFQSHPPSPRDGRVGLGQEVPSGQFSFSFGGRRPERANPKGSDSSAWGGQVVGFGGFRFGVASLFNLITTLICPHGQWAGGAGPDSISCRASYSSLI